jgi:hypothetical protein
LVRGFLGNKGEKLFRNHKRSAAEIPAVKILNYSIIEYDLWHILFGYDGFKS